MTAKIIGTVLSSKQLKAARESECNYIELRLDAFTPKEEDLSELEISKDIILTARDGLEGGAKTLTLDRRVQLIKDYITFASAIDIEGRNCHLQQAQDLIGYAHSLEIDVIASFHMGRIDSVRMLKLLLAAAVKDGANIIKLVFSPRSSEEGEAIVKEVLSCTNVPTIIMPRYNGCNLDTRMHYAQLGSAAVYGNITRATNEQPSVKQIINFIHKNYRDRT